jgi:hypothetical protein
MNGDERSLKRSVININDELLGNADPRDTVA